jgi:hypothetical protein
MIRASAAAEVARSGDSSATGGELTRGA